jgi:divalent metal cation (Fe/Co/Zn/Cd) transporter
MKNFVIAVFAILIFLIGLLAAVFEFIALLDPKGTEKSQHFIFILTAVISFLISRFLWKLSRRE